MFKKLLFFLLILEIVVSTWDHNKRYGHSKSKSRSVSRSRSDSYGHNNHGHRHGHKHNRHGRKARYTVADNWSRHGQTQGNSTAFSQGKGASSTRVGPHGGSQASSYGTHGSGSKTKYRDRVHSTRDNWSNYNDGYGNEQSTRDNWSSKQENDNEAKARAYGRGKTAAVSNNKKSAGSGWGEEKADVESDFNQKYDEKRDNWSRVKGKHGVRNIRNRYGQNGKTNTKSQARGIGNADAATNSNRSGSRNSARGDKGSMAKSKHQNEEDAWANSFDWGKNKHGKWNVGHEWNKKGHSHGETGNISKGKGHVSGYTDKDKGAGASGKGTKGTMSNAGWGKKEKAVSNNWSDWSW